MLKSCRYLNTYPYVSTGIRYVGGDHEITQIRCEQKERGTSTRGHWGEYGCA